MVFLRQISVPDGWSQVTIYSWIGWQKALKALYKQANGHHGGVLINKHHVDKSINLKCNVWSYLNLKKTKQSINMYGHVAIHTYIYIFIICLCENQNAYVVETCGETWSNCVLPNRYRLRTWQTSGIIPESSYHRQFSKIFRFSMALDISFYDTLKM